MICQPAGFLDGRTALSGLLEIRIDWGRMVGIMAKEVGNAGFGSGIIDSPELMNAGGSPPTRDAFHPRTKASDL